MPAPVHPDQIAEHLNPAPYMHREKHRWQQNIAHDDVTAVTDWRLFTDIAATCYIKRTLLMMYSQLLLLPICSIKLAYYAGDCIFSSLYFRRLPCT